MDPMMATIMMFAGNFAPRQWAFCEGQLIAISSNQALFSLLGTTWGGDGRTTFGLPDMRGRAPVGKGGGPGLTPRREGQTGGRETVTLTQAEMPLHNHSAAAQGGGLTVQNADANQGSPNSSSYIGKPVSGSGGVGLYTNSTGNPVTINGGSSPDVTIGNTGGGQSHENMQPFLVVPFIIAVQGLYPPRN
jgi:microcystin-dependent protein